jgi:hypothetical protein
MDVRLLVLDLEAQRHLTCLPPSKFLFLPFFTFILSIISSAFYLSHLVPWGAQKGGVYMGRFVAVLYSGSSRVNPHVSFCPFLFI